MSGASAFFILIPAMYALFTVALGIIALVDRRLIVARWATLGFSIAFVSILVDGFRAPFGDRWISWFSVATHFLPLLVMVQAFLSRHQRNAPVFAIALTIAGCVFIMPYMPWAPPSWVRGVAVQAVCATIIASALPGLWRHRNDSRMDIMAFVAVLGASASYAGRTVVIALNPIGETRAEITEFYNGLNIVFHSVSGLMGMCVGFVLMMIIGHDMLMGQIAEKEIDPLTGLGNRRRMESRFAEDASGQRPIGAVMMVDLDHFKAINDRFGHVGGDDVLRAVGARLAGLFANTGCVCRSGGEEFMVLLDRDYSAGVSALALATRMAVADLKFDGPLANTTVTASVGFHLRARDGSDDLREAIRLADQALYCAKANGRDRVVGATQENGLQVLKAVA